MRAVELKIPQKSYPQALGELSKPFNVIAVSGTHGKSSTTAMASRLFIQAGKDPTVVVGTKLRELDGRNWRQGASDLFVLEACEYRHSFHNYEPLYALITNCDGDHFDFYPSQQAYEDAFHEFLSCVHERGAVITHLSDPLCRNVAEQSGKRVIDADAFPLIELKTPGLHMRQNAQLVLALADELKILPRAAQAIVSGYAGSWRRMEVKGMYKNSVTIIDDYAHHPAEIRATLQGMKEAYPGKRIVCLYQPHTHDRTIKLYQDFLGAFRDLDLLVIADVYEARKDIETKTVDLDAFAEDIRKESGITVTRGGSLADIERMVQGTVRPGDVLICMGAGDITNLATTLTKIS
jgi:UDP-N-acetylmuramate--alanine ligase